MHLLMSLYGMNGISPLVIMSLDPVQVTPDVSELSASSPRSVYY